MLELLLATFLAAQDARAEVVLANDRIMPVAASVGVIPVDVHVSAGGRVLFNDTLRVARNSGASFNQNRSEASLTACDTSRGYESADRHSLSINLYLQENTPGDPRVNVSVSWQRPVPGMECQTDATRMVQVTQTVRLDPGVSQTIEGDAGLKVIVTRR